MPAPRIQPPGPSMSPTFSMSTNQPQNAMSGSIRRNLFASHLSRRPTVNTTQNVLDPPSPTYDTQPHANIFSSAPSMQSTNRTGPFGDIFDPNASPKSDTMPTSSSAFLKESIIALHPVTGRPLLPNLPTLPPRLRLSEDEEDEEDEDSDMEQDHEQQHHGGFVRSPSYHSGLDHLASASAYGLDPDLDMDSSELERLTHNSTTAGGVFPTRRDSSMRHNVHHFLDTSSDDSRADRERIEYLLFEMVSRQLARSRTMPAAMPARVSHANGTDAATNTGASGTSTFGNSNTGSTLHPTSRRRAVGLTAGSQNTSLARGTTSSTNRSRRRREPSPHNRIASQAHPKPPSSTQQEYTPANQQFNPDPATLPVGKVIDPQEKDELVELIMTSLRRKIAIADEEGWMYGHGGDGMDGMGGDLAGGGLDGDAFD